MDIEEEYDCYSDSLTFSSDIHGYAYHDNHMNNTNMVCGDGTYSTFSQTDEMLVNFISDGSVTGGGFELVFSTFPLDVGNHTPPTPPTPTYPPGNWQLLLACYDYISVGSMLARI